MSKSLSEIYKSPEWQKRRLEILNRDNFTCQLCGDTKTQLQIHHIEYGDNPLTTPSDKLVTLCEDCHYEIDVTIKECCPKKPEFEHLHIYKELSSHSYGRFLIVHTPYLCYCIAYDKKNVPEFYQELDYDKFKQVSELLSTLK